MQLFGFANFRPIFWNIARHAGAAETRLAILITEPEAEPDGRRTKNDLKVFIYFVVETKSEDFEPSQNKCQKKEEY